MNHTRHFSDAPAVDFSRLPELQPYLAEPPAMYVGAPGKCGYLNLEFARNAEGRSVLRELDRRAPLIVQRELYFDSRMPLMPCVYILSSGGPNVDGDRYTQVITVGAGAQAHIATGAATKIATMQHNYSGLRQDITVEAGGYLEVLPEQTIPAGHARYATHTTLRVHPSATAVYAEIYTCGRKHYGEEFAYDVLSLTTEGVRLDGEHLFTERMVIEPAKVDVRTPGTMSRYSTFATVIVMTTAELAEAIYGDTEARMDAHTAVGISHLPRGAGLIYRVLAQKTETAKALVREFCSNVRSHVKGVPLPTEFPWR
jgi:urease accessory protein